MIRGKLSQMFSSPKGLITGIVVGVSALLLAISLRAQPTGGRILTDITVTGDEICKTAKIGFNFPIRYINHFPQSEGNEVRIQLKPVTVDSIDAQALADREAFSPVDDATLLSNVIYEGDMPGSPYLTLQFNGSAHFTVMQGTDFRSVRVSFHASGDSCPEISASPQ
jgi:hypothetical protein